MRLAVTCCPARLRAGADQRSERVSLRAVAVLDLIMPRADETDPAQRARPQRAGSDVQSISRWRQDGMTPGVVDRRTGKTKSARTDRARVAQRPLPKEDDSPR